METICDRCGRELEADEANDGSDVGWEAATLCSECYAVLLAEQEEEEGDE